MLRETEVAAAPSRTEWLRVEVIREPRALAGMRAEWSALLEDSDAAIFNAWDWLYPWHRRIAPALEPWVLAARDRAGRLVGVFPLAREERGWGPRRARRLCFLGEERVGSDY